MKALSLTQPWAQLVVDGRKRYETRSWQAKPWEFGKPLAIHASKGWLIEHQHLAGQWGYTVDTLPRGAIVGVVRLISCLETRVLKDLSEEEREYGDFGPNRFGWQLDLMFKLEEPIVCSGALNLWDVPREIEAQLVKAVNA
ncbi:MAG: ASCH domain-containing protein [Hyphomicrobiaceae bacterium]